jgi:hypothetical protein
VALLNDVQTTHFESGSPVLLHRGDIGTVVLTYGGGECDVEFADRNGRTYAMLTRSTDSLLVLLDLPAGVAT